jgi:hypothetical protein
VLGFSDGTGRIYLDATTYLPVLETTFGMGTGPERRGYEIHYTWTLLPLTRANRALLDLAKVHRGATVIRLGGSAWDARATGVGRRWRPPVTPGA